MILSVECQRAQSLRDYVPEKMQRAITGMEVFDECFLLVEP